MTVRTSSEVPYRALVEHSPEATFVVRAGRIVFMNASAVRMFGAPSAEALLGTDVLDRIHPDDHTLALERRKQVLELNAPAPLVEMRFIALDGRIFDVEVQATAIEFDGERATYAAARDISSRKLMEEQVRQSQKLEAVGRLAGGIAHDFNNTLAVILGHAEFVLQELPPDHPLHDDMRAIECAAQRSAALTRQLLTYARRQTVSPRSLDLNESVTETMRMLRPLIGEGIELAWSPGEGLWPITLDPAQLDQILTNLCANARDAMNGVGRLSIATSNCTLDAVGCLEIPASQPGDYVRLRITDDGSGMSDETRSMIFEPFFTTKGLGQGTGLGLSSVYGIVRQNHGAITVESTVGVGTQFDIYLPRRTAQPEPTVASAPVLPASRGSETILVVEDQTEILMLAQRALTARGYTVLAADGPEKALAISRAHPAGIDLLLTDVMMPAMSGPDLARLIAAERPVARVLFMSGFSADLIASDGLLDVDTQFLGKPFTTAELCARVRTLLDAPRPDSLVSASDP